MRSAIRLNLAKCPQNAKTIPLCQNRGPGRPLKAREALNGQRAHEAIISDEEDDEYLLNDQVTEKVKDPSTQINQNQDNPGLLKAVEEQLGLDKVHLKLKIKHNS